MNEPEFREIANDMESAATEIVEKNAKVLDHPGTKRTEGRGSSQERITEAHTRLMVSPVGSPESLQAWEDILDALVEK